MTNSPFKALAIAAAFGTLAVSCNMQSSGTAASAQPDIPALTAQIQAMEDAYATAMVARDADAVVGYYADDVVSYAREKEPAVGKAAMRQRLQEQIERDTLGTTPSFKGDRALRGRGPYHRDRLLVRYRCAGYGGRSWHLLQHLQEERRQVALHPRHQRERKAEGGCRCHAVNPFHFPGCALERAHPFFHTRQRC
jgi:hypothetical protein